MAFLCNFVTEFPSPARWLTPYVQGGGGIANVRHSADFFFEDRDGRRTLAPNRNRRGMPQAIPDDTRLVRVASGRSETNLALSVGGGVDFSIWRGLAAGPNITFMKFIGGAEDIDSRHRRTATYGFRSRRLYVDATCEPPRSAATRNCRRRGRRSGRCARVR